MFSGGVDKELGCNGLSNIFMKKVYLQTGFVSTWRLLLVYIYQTEENCCQVRPSDKIMSFFDWCSPGLWKMILLKDLTVVWYKAI